MKRRAPFGFDALARAVGPGKASSDFDFSPDIVPPKRKLTPAAVLVGFCEGRSGLELLLTKRASGMRHHPGQIAFPGGKMEVGETAERAAIREAKEEIGVPSDQVRILGRLAHHQSVTGFDIIPILARVEGRFPSVLQRSEVEELFSVPIHHVADSKIYRREGRFFRGIRRDYLVAPFGPYYIWGATARILFELARRLEALDAD